MMMLAELLVSTDFGVCLLVELACRFSDSVILVNCWEYEITAHTFD